MFWLLNIKSKLRMMLSKKMVLHCEDYLLSFPKLSNIAKHHLSSLNQPPSQQLSIALYFKEEGLQNTHNLPRTSFSYYNEFFGRDYFLP